MKKKTTFSNRLQKICFLQHGIQDGCDYEIMRILHYSASWHTASVLGLPSQSLQKRLKAISTFKTGPTNFYRLLERPLSSSIAIASARESWSDAKSSDHRGICRHDSGICRIRTWLFVNSFFLEERPKSFRSESAAFEIHGRDFPSLCRLEKERNAPPNLTGCFEYGARRKNYSIRPTPCRSAQPLPCSCLNFNQRSLCSST